MAGYTRQSTADIIPTATVRAAPLNAEYNAIRDAFSASGGHRHDGTAAEGDYVPLISDLDNYNKVVIDSTNNRVGVFVEVSAAAVEQVRFQDGAIVPVTTNDIDLGTSSLKFKDLYLEGTATIGSISLDGGTIDDTVIGGTTPAAATFTTMTATTVDINGGAIDGTIIGATTPAAADFTTMDASGNATVGGTFSVTGNTTIGGTLGVTGVTTLGTANITSVDLDSGAIDNTTIGAATPAAGTFTTLTANTSLTAATADINGGTLDGVIIGGTTSAAATVTDLTATGTSTLTTVDINGGAIDGTTIGASSAAAGSFTTVSTSGQATLATADINGGTIDGTTIGTTTPAAITGTTVTATSFVGPVTGAVTGNVTGNVTGDLTGDVTGNITSTGSSSFNNVTIDGTLNMNAGTTATITNLTSPTNTNDAATKGYVDTSISNLVDSAPGTLDTLNELAAALGDDPNFSTTITNSIATKLPLAGGTMTGAIAMSTNKITGLGDPTAAQDAMTKAYADATYLALSGGTMTGAIDMGSQKITTTYTPTNAADLTTKTYVDGILGSATAASASAAAAATSEANAATSETNASNSASSAATSESNTATLYDNFDDRYLGAKATAPTVDNDGDALITGALYFNTTTNIMNVYGTSGWQSAGSAVNGTSDRQTYTATSGQTVFAATYDTGYVDVYLNGVKLLAGTDFTATNGTSITLTTGAAVNDIVDIVAYGTFVLADHYSKSQSDARYVEVAGDTMTGNLDVQGTITADGLTVDGSSTFDDIKLTAVALPAAGNPSIALRNTDNNIYIQSGSGNGVTLLDSSQNTLLNATPTSHSLQISNGNAFSINSGRDISFYEDTGTTPKFFWDASAESLGIGTSSPAAELDVRGNTTSTIRVGSTAQGNSGDEFGNIDFYWGDPDASGIKAKIYAKNVGNVGPGGSGTADLLFATTPSGGSATERMRIDSSGVVTIGHPDAASYGGGLVVADLTGSYITVADNGSGERLHLEGGSGSTTVGSKSNHDLRIITNDAEIARFDTSGNLMIGGTNGNPIGNHVSQVIANGTNGLGVHRDGGVPFKAGTDGNRNVIEAYNQGVLVGGIASVANTRASFRSANTVGYLGVGSTDYYGFKSTAFVPTTSASYDLGGSAEKFKDLYLSGGVYLGGTGAANKLDDYEEGTYTVTMTPQYGTFTLNSGQDLAKYVKIGSLVYVSGQVRLSSVSGVSGAHVSFSLPFANSTGNEISHNHWNSIVMYNSGYTNRDQGLWIYESNSFARFLDSNYNYIPPGAFSGNEEIIFSFTYRTDA